MSPRSRAAMTAAELMVSISIFMVLAGLSVATLGPFLSKGRLAEATSIIDAANQEARTYARVQPVVTGRFFGVRLDGDATPNAVEVIRSDGGAITVLQKHSLGRNTELWKGSAKLSGQVTWYFQSRTGYPIRTPSATATVEAIGAVSATDTNHLSVRARNGKSRYGVAVYEIGIVHAEEF